MKKYIAKKIGIFETLVHPDEPPPLLKRLQPMVRDHSFHVKQNDIGISIVGSNDWFGNNRKNNYFLLINYVVFLSFFRNLLWKLYSWSCIGLSIVINLFELNIRGFGCSTVRTRFFEKSSLCSFKVEFSRI